jgi:hypothetical protein
VAIVPKPYQPTSSVPDAKPRTARASDSFFKRLRCPLVGAAPRRCNRRAVWGAHLPHVARAPLCNWRPTSCLHTQKRQGDFSWHGRFGACEEWRFLSWRSMALFQCVWAVVSTVLVLAALYRYCIPIGPEFPGSCERTTGIGRFQPPDRRISNGRYRRDLVARAPP